jgi:hypothetical protein
MEYFVEEIIPLANEITRGSSTEIEAIEKIVLWVRENIGISWTAVGSNNIAEDILANREGKSHCDSWATLITAFSRAIGIPAKKVGGSFGGGLIYLYGHAWTEAYVDGNWIMVDSTGGLEENPEQMKWLHSVYTYDPIHDRLKDVSLSYSAGVLDLIIEHVKGEVGETAAVKSAQEIFIEYEKENNLTDKYAFAQEIMALSISELIAKQGEYEQADIKVINLWDWDKLKREESFLAELKSVKAISVYDSTGKHAIPYKGTDTSAFPLNKINTVIPEIKQLFQGKIFFLFVHYKGTCEPFSDAVAINLFNPEDVAVLETVFGSLSADTPELLKNFATEISKVASKEKDSTTFYLPEDIQEGVEYSIVTSGALSIGATSYDIFFDIQSMITIQDIMLILVANQGEVMTGGAKRLPWGKFDNLKLIDRAGKVYADPQIYRNPRPDLTATAGQPPYNIDDSPSGTFVIPGQIVEIYREGDLIIIKGDLTTEQIIVD